MMIARLTEITTRSMNIPGSLFNAMEAEFFLLFAFLIMIRREHPVWVMLSKLRALTGYWDLTVNR